MSLGNEALSANSGQPLTTFAVDSLDPMVVYFQSVIYAYYAHTHIFICCCGPACGFYCFRYSLLFRTLF